MPYATLYVLMLVIILHSFIRLQSIKKDNMINQNYTMIIFTKCLFLSIQVLTIFNAKN